MILLIDNYDSFVYNLARYVGQLGHACHVVRNDATTLAEIRTLNPSHIILSPGPCTPNEAGITLELITHFYQSIPILGICLGHQAIGQVFHGKITNATQPTHGRSIDIRHNGEGVFRYLPSPLRVGLYHSLIVQSEHLLPEVEVTATNHLGEIMALRHTKFPTIGLQFHPESILTQGGYQLLANFLNMTGATS